MLRPRALHLPAEGWRVRAAVRPSRRHRRLGRPRHRGVCRSWPSLLLRPRGHVTVLVDHDDHACGLVHQGDRVVDGASRAGRVREHAHGESVDVGAHVSLPSLPSDDDDGGDGFDGTDEVAAQSSGAGRRCSSIPGSTRLLAGARTASAAPVRSRRRPPRAAPGHGPRAWTRSCSRGSSRSTGSCRAGRRSRRWTGLGPRARAPRALAR